MQVKLVGHSPMGLGATSQELEARAKGLVAQGPTEGDLAENLVPLSNIDRDLFSSFFVAAGGDAVMLSSVRGQIARQESPVADIGTRRKGIMLAAGSGFVGLVIGIIVGRLTKK